MSDPQQQDGHRTRMRVAIVVALTAAVVAPATAWAANNFTDVPNSNVFHDDIEWMRDTGVTKGCNPPKNDNYCPDEFVTREQMAAFMHRLETEGVFLPADGTAVAADRASVGLSPVAYATVLANGSVVADRSRGVGASNVTFENISTYCFEDLGFEFRTAQATPIYEGGGADDITTLVGLPGVAFGAGDCASSDAELEIATVKDSGFAPRGFIVWFYN